MGTGPETFRRIVCRDRRPRLHVVLFVLSYFLAMIAFGEEKGSLKLEVLLYSSYNRSSNSSTF